MTRIWKVARMDILGEKREAGQIGGSPRDPLRDHRRDGAIAYDVTMKDRRPRIGMIYLRYRLHSLRFWNHRQSANRSKSLLERSPRL